MELEFRPSLMNSEHFHILNDYIFHGNFKLDLNRTRYTGVSSGDDGLIRNSSSTRFLFCNIQVWDMKSSLYLILKQNGQTYSRTI